MKLVIGSDHAGFKAKDEVVKILIKEGHEVTDVGTMSLASTNYPVYAIEAANRVATGEADLGILICSSGEGIMIAANKVKGVRCGLGYNDEVSALLRQHNDANMIAFGANFMTVEEIARRINIFINSKFEQGRHSTRVDLIKEYEK